MNSRRLFAAAVVLALLVAVVLALPVSGSPLATLKANLTGEQQVTSGDPDGSGTAVVEVFETKVCYTLEVRRIASATAAHINLGLRGEQHWGVFGNGSGPVVALLEPPVVGSSSDCVSVPRALSLELREHPARYYINVKNSHYAVDDYPDGAIRGQLERA